VVERLSARTRLIVALLALTAFCVALFGVRVWYADELRFRFLLWNLFLAWIPVPLAIALARDVANTGRLRAQGLFFGAGWLLFFPNAPYIITDFVHLYDDPPVPLWFDALGIGAFAWTGLLLGLVSLAIVHETVRRFLTSVQAWIVVCAATVLAAFGVYVVQDPANLGRDLRGELANPLEHPRTFVVTGIVALLLLLSYGVLDALRARQPDRERSNISR
jgi:uncharacterized membrane protein